jgi:hypothetical protein
LPLAHHGGHLFQTANIPTVISPILERKLFHRVQLNSAALNAKHSTDQGRKLRRKRSIYCPLPAALFPSLIASCSVMYLPSFDVP